MPIFLGHQRSARQGNPALGLISRAPLLSGEGGTAQTVAVMRQLVDQAQADPQFVRFVVDLVRGVQAYDDMGEAEAIYRWVQTNIRYTKDPVSKEKLYPPQELLKIRAGDCDDISMLLGAMGLVLGYPARLATIGANPNSPQEFSHVYVELEVPPGSGEWLPLDAARPGAQFGIEPPFYFRKKVWSLTDNSSQDLDGCNCGGTCGAPGLAGYPRMLGDANSDALLEQSLQEIPQILAITSGQSSSMSNPAGMLATGPYASFATPYTPGATVLPAGYGSTASVAATGAFASIWPWLAVGALALMAFSGKGRH